MTGTGVAPAHGRVVDLRGTPCPAPRSERRCQPSATIGTRSAWAAPVLTTAGGRSTAPLPTRDVTAGAGSPAPSRPSGDTPRLGRDYRRSTSTCRTSQQRASGCGRQHDRRFALSRSAGRRSGHLYAVARHRGPGGVPDVSLTLTGGTSPPVPETETYALAPDSACSRACAAPRFRHLRVARGSAPARGMAPTSPRRRRR